jgi:hypothetical protein
MTARPKLAVLDANYYWTEQLFSACGDFADVLLLRPRDFRSFRREHGRLFVDLAPRPLGDAVWEQRICCPPGWLFHYWPASRAVFGRLIRRFQGDGDLIFVFCYPYYRSLARRLNAVSVYYNIDDYEGYWPGRELSTRREELEAVADADLSVCVASRRAEYLRRQVPAKAEEIIHLPHGCSPTFMVDEPLTGAKPLPRSLGAARRPVAGYVGALDYRFDYRYLAGVAAAMPEVTFVLGGEEPRASGGTGEWWGGVERVRRLANVRFIGRVPHERLGEHLQSFDVLLMAYSDCNFNRNCCPMKLWDYMGTSLPIVTNDVVPEVRQWRHVIRVARDPAEFVAHIRASLARPGWMSAERLEVAKSHTWRLQALKLRTALETRLPVNAR